MLFSPEDLYKEDNMKEFAMPTMNLFEAGSIKGLGSLVKRINGNKGLLITDSNLVSCGICLKIEKILQTEGIEYVVFDKVQPNPSKENVYEAVECYKLNECDFIIGLGGGSSNDCAKAASILITNGGEIEDYAGGNMSKNQGIPIIAINTTAGTASEISRAYLISDNEKKVKIIAKDIHALPFATINDAELMLNLPQHITAQTGMDALSHAIESYVCNIKTPMTQELAIAACRMIFANLREVIETPDSVSLRENMSYAQMLAGMAFCNSGVGIGHSIGHSIGTHYHLGHGLCVGIVLPSVMRFNAKTESEEYAKLARAVFPLECDEKNEDECVEYLISAVEKLSVDMGTDKKLLDLNIDINDVKKMAECALSDGNTGRNPIVPTMEEMEMLILSLY